MSMLEFVLVNNFKCKRCGCTNYDKIMYTGFNTLDEENAVKSEKYVCRNCDYPVDINQYISNDSIKMDKDDLLNQSKFIDEGVMTYE